MWSRGRCCHKWRWGAKKMRSRRFPKRWNVWKSHKKWSQEMQCALKKRYQPRLLGEGYIFPVKENQLSLDKNIQQSLRQNIRRQDFERSRQISSPSRKSTKDMGALKTYPDHQWNAQLLFGLAGLSSGLLPGKTVPMVAQWTLLSHILRGGIWNHQLFPQKDRTWLLIMFSSRALGIETGLHYRRDVTFKEDATRMTIGNTGKVMASINNLVIALISQANFQNAAYARRWFAAHLPEAFALLTTSFSWPWKSHATSFVFSCFTSLLTW